MDKERYKRVTGYIPKEREMDWDELKDHRGMDSDSSLMSLLFIEEFRRATGQNTKELALKRIETALETLEAKADLALYVAWAAYARSGGMVAKIDIDDVRALREGVQELIAVK